ncbi:MAG: PIN domain-containing protein [Candidatus Rokubacteria bacterium]|nr:PIN domain-containing protein [Candidatus Rokubacteria bacterium]
MKVFVDTNLFVYALDRLSPFHGAATEVLQRIDAGELEGHCSYQVLTEFYSAVTKNAARPLTPHQAAREGRRLLDAEKLVKLPVDAVALDLTFALARKYRLRGVVVFDAQIVGTMLSHRIGRLYTANERDFARFREIEVVNPLTHQPRSR